MQVIQSRSIWNLSVTVYENPEEIYYYIAVSTDQEVSENMMQYEIPEATWVIFECEGKFKSSIQNVFQRFLTEWLPFSGYQYAELPDIEIYPVSNDKLKGGHSEAWIAIQMRQ